MGENTRFLAPTISEDVHLTNTSDIKLYGITDPGANHDEKYNWIGVISTDENYVVDSNNNVVIDADAGGPQTNRHLAISIHNKRADSNAYEDTTGNTTYIRQVIKHNGYGYVAMNKKLKLHRGAAIEFYNGEDSISATGVLIEETDINGHISCKNTATDRTLSIRLNGPNYLNDKSDFVDISLHSTPTKDAEGNISTTKSITFTPGITIASANETFNSLDGFADFIYDLVKNIEDGGGEVSVDLSTKIAGLQTTVSNLDKRVAANEVRIEVLNSDSTIEGSIDNRVKAEETRATGIEAGLRTDVDAAAAKAAANETAIGVLNGAADVAGSVAKSIKDAIANLIPPGAIWWFHNRTDAPDGWAICDGSTVTMNDGTTLTTPDLIGRYPLGATSNIGDEINNTVGGAAQVYDTGPTPAYLYTKAVKLLPCMKK